MISEINGRLGKLKEINAQLAARDGAAATPATAGAAPAANAAGAAAAAVVIAAGFTAELALKPEEQPEIREVGTGLGKAGM